MFQELKKKVQTRFAEMQSGTVYQTDYNRDEIWRVYLDSFAEDVRQSSNCNCCKAFIRQIGGAVTINEKNEIETLWDLTGVSEEYAASVKALHKYIKTLPIIGLYYHEQKAVGTEQKAVGTDKSPDPKNNTVWQHFHLALPRTIVGDLAAKSGAARTSQDILLRTLDLISNEAIDDVQGLIAQNSLYRGSDHAVTISKFKELKGKFKIVPAAKREAFCWRALAENGPAVTHIKNTSIGTLLIDLSEGKDLDKSVRSYESIVAPANYKRPTALVTPKMIEAAKKKVEDLGLLPSLNRRKMSVTDLKIDNAIFVNRPKPGITDIFGELAKDSPVDKKSLSKVEEVGIQDFISRILPTVDSVSVLLEREHLGNLATMTCAADEDAPNLFKWGNNVGWSYSGGVADSIEERVKSAGGKTDGWLRISLSWYNFDDLDIYFTCVKTGRCIYYGYKDAIQNARLDVDMNISPTTREAVENIHISQKLPAGKYEIKVKNHNRRETKDQGFEIEVEGANVGVANFSSAKSPASGLYSDTICFNVDASGAVTFLESKFSKSSSSVSKWGLKTGTWHKVNAVALSPNYWNGKEIDNKHLFFFLKGCMTDEPTRPFYNEFLVDELRNDRKVTEVLANKIQVAESGGEELSGLGFSSTVRNSIYVEVESSFKRVIKVNL